MVGGPWRFHPRLEAPDAEEGQTGGGEQWLKNTLGGGSEVNGFGATGGSPASIGRSLPQHRTVHDEYTMSPKGTSAAHRGSRSGWSTVDLADPHSTRCHQSTQRQADRAVTGRDPTSSGDEKGGMIDH